MNPDIIIESAEIIAIGTELLIGQTLNTNSYYLANQLTLLGISSYNQTVVGDNPKRLEEALRNALRRADLIITSGGLGPTADDISMQYAAEVAGVELVLHEESKERINQYFKKLNRTPCENNWKQALLPKDGVVLQNNNGTAPGAVMVFEYEGKQKAIACLPGPPDELKPMFETELKPWLEQRVAYIFKNRFLHMIGIGESNAETELKDLIDKQENPTIAPYASPGEVCFRLTERIPRGEQDDDAEKEDRLQDLVDQVYERLGQYIYEDGNRSFPQIIFDILAERNETISFAESCTAGLASSRLGDIPGASAVFKGSIISYSNDVKNKQLNVSSEILEKYGAVSEQCAKAMAEGVAKSLKTDLGIAITGIAGPDGGSEEKPVGTVYVAAYYQGKTYVEHYRFNGNRNRIRNVATLRAYYIAWETLMDRH